MSDLEEIFADVMNFLLLAVTIAALAFFARVGWNIADGCYVRTVEQAEESR